MLLYCKERIDLIFVTAFLCLLTENSITNYKKTFEFGILNRHSECILHKTFCNYQTYFSAHTDAQTKSNTLVWGEGMLFEVSSNNYFRVSML